MSLTLTILPSSVNCTLIAHGCDLILTVQTQLTAWSFFLAALANSERSRLENTEDNSQASTTKDTVE